MEQANLFQEKKTRSVKGKKQEEKLQLAVCNYIRLAYPDAIFMCDLASGLRLPIWIAAMNKKMRSSRGQPDLFIAQKSVMYGESIHMRREFSGLFLELKREGTTILVKGKDGMKTYTKDKHIQEQLTVLFKLQSFGYRAEFAVGFDEAKRIIDEHMKGS